MGDDYSMINHLFDKCMKMPKGVYSVELHLQAASYHFTDSALLYAF